MIDGTCGAVPFENVWQCSIIGCGMETYELRRDIEKLRQALGKLPHPALRPSLIMPVGLPGTGKSHFCRQLAHRLPLVTVESDRSRRTLFRRPRYSAEENCRLFWACSAVVEDLLREGISVAFDATNLEERHREPFYRMADRIGVELIIVKIDAPADVVRERLEKRALGMGADEMSEADWNVYCRMRSAAQRIGRGHIAVDTSQDIRPALEAVVSRMSQAALTGKENRCGH
ncbi:MAG: ATP-binding protein [Chloroflexi bacterium]|nr:ATP-binding protein [Chloroflexota bacterium]